MRYLYITMVLLMVVSVGTLRADPFPNISSSSAFTVKKHRQRQRNKVRNPRSLVLYTATRKGDIITVTYKSVTTKTMPLTEVLVPVINRKVEPVVEYGFRNVYDSKDMNNYDTAIPYFGFWLGLRRDDCELLFFCVV